MEHLSPIWALDQDWIRGRESLWTDPYRTGTAGSESRG